MVHANNAGYLGDDKATAETIDSEGWLKTGDLCNFDSQGFLFIVGRLKELIKYKAYQVPPAELEHLLLSNPEIVDAAVIPYPDEDVGQIPMAFVVRKLGSNITEAQVMEFTAKCKTETGGMTAATMEPVEVTRLDSVGRLAEFMEAKIVDPITGEALFPGKEGELWLRGPNIMKGYVGDDKATAEALDSEGWLKTGDLCYFDSQGLLFIVSRLKELIKYKAFQVPPAELEHLLLSIPEIADAAVIPYPDEDVGQIPMAFVVRKLESNITESQVIEFIAKQVAPYKQIRRFAFINSIPRSHAGKILRRELVDRALSANFSTSS
ncbi:hypothetical protein Q3G72_004249 [Acer saccharum]|nr:hypothetical protein Q3G72_004249 [Acer saccharum]